MILDYKDRHKGETCLVIGNGPSLEKTPVSKLMQKYASFGANKIYGRFPMPDYYTCVDYDMLHECVVWLSQNGNLWGKGVFVRREFPLSGANLLTVEIDNDFSKDASARVVIGGTVTYVNLQLAWFMGFKIVLLIGVDHKYQKTVQGGRPGSKFIGDGDDPDHFKLSDGSSYFSAGHLYNRPELDAVAKYTYPLAKKVFEADGRKIFNLTPGTALDVFEKRTLEEWL